MKLAIVGWATDTGVGREFTDAVRNLPLVGCYVLPHLKHPTRTDLLPEHAFVARGSWNPLRQMRDFLDKTRPDVILTWEIPGSWEFPELWHARGIRWVNVVHWDWFAPDMAGAWSRANLIAPNVLCQKGLKDRYGLSSTFLPVPIDTDAFPFVERQKVEKFVTVYGEGGVGDRRSLAGIALAWRSLLHPPRLLLRAKRPPKPWEFAPDGIELDLSERTNPATLYEGAEVALLPSKYEGVGLSLLEAQSCGLPVVTVDAPPMNELAPDLLIPARWHEEPIMRNHEITFNTLIPEALAQKILELVGSDVRDLSRKARERVESKFSWRALRGEWIRELSR